MATFGAERDTQGGRRHIALAAAIMLLALATPYFSDTLQQRVSFALQATALRPFIVAQRRLTESRRLAEQVRYLRRDLDSLVAVTATQSTLADENRTLRELLGLAERAGPAFVPASVLRPGTPGSESMFLLDVGFDRGLREGAPVLSARGLLGVILEVRARSAVGMDWTHPDFRVSVMLAEDGTLGIVENVRGSFREQDRLLLNGTAYHEAVLDGSLVVTSGLGGVFPRGIPIGRIDGTAQAQGNWLKSYWVRPAVQPGSATHVLVETRGEPHDLASVWAPSDSLAAGEEGRPRGPDW